MKLMINKNHMQNNMKTATNLLLLATVAAGVANSSQFDSIEVSNVLVSLKDAREIEDDSDLKKKKCSKCLQMLPLENFPKRAKNLDSRCKECRNKLRRYYRKNRNNQEKEMRKNPANKKKCVKCKIEKIYKAFHLGINICNECKFKCDVDDANRKTCNICREKLPAENFTKFSNECKNCRQIHHKKRRDRDREISKNPVKKKTCSLCNKEKAYNAFSPGRGQCRECRKKRSLCEHNKLKHICYICSPFRYLFKRISHCVHTGITRNMQSRKTQRTEKILKCTKAMFWQRMQQKIDYYNNHLKKPNEALLTAENMHLDHIKPCAAFDKDRPDDIKNANHHSNFQPLPKRLNLIKCATWSTDDDKFWTESIFMKDYAGIYWPRGCMPIESIDTENGQDEDKTNGQMDNEDFSECDSSDESNVEDLDASDEDATDENMINEVMNKKRKLSEQHSTFPT